MIARDPNIAKLELIASALGSLREQVVFVGGCSVGLLITDASAAPCAQLLTEQHFADYLPGLIAPGEDLAERALIVAERLEAIARMRE